MEQYILKSALVREIEKRIEGINPLSQRVGVVGCSNTIKHLRGILSFINTLEVKELDLEKEINKYISDNFFGSETMGFFSSRTNEEPNDIDMALCAKYFFELGLLASNKIQKGE